MIKSKKVIMVCELKSAFVSTNNFIIWWISKDGVILEKKSGRKTIRIIYCIRTVQE